MAGGSSETWTAPSAVLLMLTRMTVPFRYSSPEERKGTIRALLIPLGGGEPVSSCAEEVAAYATVVGIRRSGVRVGERHYLIFPM
jgi:hypothetical protein